MTQVLSIDAGTTGITAMVVDGANGIVSKAYKEIHQSYPQAGWVEHDPLEIWRTAKSVAKQALAGAGISGPIPIGITNQRETTIVWNRKTGKPVYPAIVWQDRRTAARCKELVDHEKRIHHDTGLVADPYFSATKLEWILDQHDPKRQGAKRDLLFGTVDSWLAWNLTGRHVTDDTNASRTMLYNIRKSQWDAHMLSEFDIPADMLPDVVSSAGVIGETLPGTIAPGSPVAALVGDQQSALFGQGCTKPGQAKNTYGTGCFLLQHTGSQLHMSKHGILTTRAASIDATPRYAMEGSVFIGGAAIQWLRDGLKFFKKAPDVNVMADTAVDSDGVTVVPAFQGLGAPHWDTDARGAILGLSRRTTRRHIARATLEAIAHQCTDLMQSMARDAKVPFTELRVDGGAAQSELLMQMQADLAQIPVIRPRNVETTGLGAAYLAGIAMQAWTEQDLPAQPVDSFQPKWLLEESAKARGRWKRAVAAVRDFGS